MLMPSDTTKLSRETSVTPASCWLLVMVAIVACVNSSYKSACKLDTQESYAFAWTAAQCTAEWWGAVAEITHTVRNNGSYKSACTGFVPMPSQVRWLPSTCKQANKMLVLCFK